MEAGLDPDTFWQLTPWQTRVMCRAGQNRMLTLAWHVAAFERQKKLPKLESLLVRQKTKPGKAQIEAYMERIGVVTKGAGNG